MDFELSDEQQALARSVAALCARRFPLESVRAAEGARRVIDPDGWGELAQAGVFTLRLAETDGGVGLGLADAAVVYEELGRALVPGPLVATQLAATVLGAAAPELSGAGGSVVGSVRRPAGDHPVLAEHLETLDVLVVVDDERRTLSLVDPPSLEAAPIERPLDPLTPLWRVTTLPEGTTVGGEESYGRWVREEEVLTGAQCVGLAAASCALAVAYAGQRRQFGRPIGSFQAIKHLCADMLVRTECARAAVHAAACAVDQPGVGDPVRAAAGAALLAAEAAQANAKACIQVHGGMGFTWEVPAHLYLMRARVLSSSLRPADQLALQVAGAY